MSEILPLIDGQSVDFIGEINEREKTKFLGEAGALLFPVDWPEPFGLVMIEAMALPLKIAAKVDKVDKDYRWLRVR